MNNLQIIHGHPVIELLSVDSSNNYAAILLKNGNPSEGTVILSHFQSEGRGQRGTTWSAEPRQNLTFSIITYPKFLKVEDVFRLTQVSALAVRATIDELVDQKVEIKWPNDILVDGQKISGILIENSITGKQIESAVIGIGINVNQDFFEAPNATSLFLLKNSTFGLTDCLAKFLKNFDVYYHQLKSGQSETLKEAYHEHLFQQGVKRPYRVNGKDVEGTILSVNDDGNLNLKTDAGQLKLGIKEVEFLR